MKKSYFFVSLKPFQPLFWLILEGGGVRGGLTCPCVLTDCLKTYSPVALEINSWPVGQSVQ